jgi:hypothetical protein
VLSGTRREGAGCGNPPMRGQAVCRMQGGPVRRPGGQRHVGWWQPGSAGPSGTGCIVTAEEVIGVASDRDCQAVRLHRRRRSYARIAEHLGTRIGAAHWGALRGAPCSARGPRRRSCGRGETDERLLGVQRRFQ